MYVPAERADAEQAMTRLASVTATGAVGGRPDAAAAATAGQSMHQMASTRAMARYPPTAALIGPKDRPQARMASRTLLIRPHPGWGYSPASGRCPQPAPVTS